MIDDRILELMNREIDKANSDKETAELNKYLSENPEAKQHYHELVKMTGALHNIPNVKPPSDMKKNIMNSIDPDKYARKVKQPGFFQTLAEFFQVRPKLRLATTFAVGAAFGLALFAVSDKYTGADIPLNQSHLSGTLMLDKNLDEFKPVDIRKINTDFCQGSFEVKNNGKEIIADLTLDSKHAFNVSVSYSGTFRGLNQSAFNYSEVYIEQDIVHWKHQGSNRYLISSEMASKESDIVLEIALDGKYHKETITVVIP